MSFKDDLAAAKAARSETVMVDVAIGESLYQIEVRRLDGMQWADIMADAPPNNEVAGRLGFDVYKAALIACRKYSRLLDADGNEVPDVDWGDLFAAISGAEVSGIGATWWALNMADPNRRVDALKKASAARTEM